MSDGSASKGGSALEKLGAEMGPLIVFFAVYFAGPRLFEIEGRSAIFYATGAFMAAFALSFIYQALRFKRIAPMLIITAVIVGVLGGLTIFLQNQTFIYIKPTITNLLFASLLAGGLLTQRLFLRIVFDGAFHLPDGAWRTLTWRFVAFFLTLAVLNEIVWRGFSEAFWVNFKVFGVMPLTILFVLSQMPFIMRHAKDNTEGK